MLVQYRVSMQLEVAVRLGPVLACCLSFCGCWVSLDGLVSVDCILLFLADGLRPFVVHYAARPLCAPPGCGVQARGLRFWTAAELCGLGSLACVGMGCSRL